jgi:hypothetical protein
MARLSDGKPGNRIIVTPMAHAADRSPWSIQSYPKPDPAFESDKRQTTPTTERLFWRSDGTLAYRAGQDHPVEEESLLLTWDELMKKKVHA